MCWSTILSPNSWYSTAYWSYQPKIIIHSRSTPGKFGPCGKRLVRNLSQEWELKWQFRQWWIWAEIPVNCSYLSCTGKNGIAIIRRRTLCKAKCSFQVGYIHLHVPVHRRSVRRTRNNGRCLFFLWINSMGSIAPNRVSKKERWTGTLPLTTSLDEHTQSLEYFEIQ